MPRGTFWVLNKAMITACGDGQNTVRPGQNYNVKRSETTMQCKQPTNASGQKPSTSTETNKGASSQQVRNKNLYPSPTLLLQSGSTDDGHRLVWTYIWWNVLCFFFTVYVHYWILFFFTVCFQYTVSKKWKTNVSSIIRIKKKRITFVNLCYLGI